MPPAVPSAQPADTTPTTPTLSRPLVVGLLALLCCLLWGSSYPAIKSGYALFGIVPGDLPGQLVFAGWRFVLAGAAVLIVARAMGKPLTANSRQNALPLIVLGTGQTALQYVFFYIGLAHTTGVKSSIMNATATFFSVLLAHAVYTNDRLNARKSLGCLIGFAGVLAVTLGGGGTLGGGFTWLGEGAVILAAFILAAFSIYGKQLSQRLDAMVMTGWQLAWGGVVLLAVGWALGGSLAHGSVAALALLGYLALLSSAAFTLWSMLLKHNRVSQVTVYNFTVPVFGSLLSAAFLGETFWAWHYVVALVLVCAGIWLVTRESRAGSGRQG